MYHEPVLKNEIVSFLNCRSEGIYVDLTLGGGGYSEAILEAAMPGGKVVGFDRDDAAIKESETRLKKFSDRFVARKISFSQAATGLANLGIESVNGIVADLGVSSHQIDQAERGFSFSKDAVLDMRMDPQQELSAYEIVNESGAEDLANWIFEYGEERFSRRIARAIVRERQSGPIDTTGRLAEIVARAVPAAARRGRIHPATRTFQALRIVVNDELAELKSLLETMPGFLSSGGRMIIVSYHSLEDRLVKQKFLELAATGEYKRVTKKPVRPTEEETERNRRARSARLRVLERV